MKCVKLPASAFGTMSESDFLITVRRCSDTHAAYLVAQGKWQYASKAEWKHGGRAYTTATQGDTP